MVATPPLRGEAADLAAGGEHAMARHDDRERIAPERLPDGARRARRAEARRDVAVRKRRARRDGAGDLVDAAVERRHLVHVERDGGEIARLAAQQRDDAVDERAAPRAAVALRLRRETAAACAARVSPLARLRELHAGDAALAPSDAATADRRVEERKAASPSWCDCSTRGRRRDLENFCCPMARSAVRRCPEHALEFGELARRRASETAQKPRSPSFQWRRL